MMDEGYSGFDSEGRRNLNFFCDAVCHIGDAITKWFNKLLIIQSNAMHHSKVSLLVFIVLLTYLSAQAQQLKPGPQVLTFFSDADDTEQPYGIYIPKNYNPTRKYPLVIMLHGAGSNHRLALRRVFGKSN